MTKGVTPIDDNIHIERNKQQKEIMNKITLQIIENKLPINNVTQTCDFDGSDLDKPAYKWFNTETKKWYIGDKWSQKCNFSPNSAKHCGGKHYIAKLFRNIKIVT